MRPAAAPAPALQVRRVLFPTDFSACAAHAFAHATSIARRLGAELHVLHALPPQWQGFYDPMLFAPVSDTAYAEARAAVAKRLDELARDPLAAGLRVVTAQVEDYPPAPGILDYAERQGIDLIVLGTHGRRGPARLLLGSVAEEVARHAACPVLAVRERNDEPPAAHLLPRQLLVPYDFSVHSRHALGQAVELARLYEAELLVLHVVEERLAAEEIAGKAARVVLAGVEEVVERCRARLEELVAEMASGVRARVEVRVGRPATEILSVAARPDVDLVVMSTLGLTGVRRLLFGSTAEEVLRLAAAPVLLVKTPVGAEEPSEAGEETAVGAGEPG